MLRKVGQFLKYRILQVEATRNCNLTCEICMRRVLKSTSGMLSFGKFKELMNATSPYYFREIALHGWGEPFLNPEIFRMISYAKKRGFKTSITTNGTFLTENNINRLLDSGLDILALGYYDMNIASKSLSKAENLLKKISEEKAKLRVFLDVTFFKENVEEIPEVVRVAKSIGVREVVLHRLFKIHGVASEFRPLSSEEEKQFFPMLEEVCRKLGVKVYLPAEHKLPCRVVEHTLFVTYDLKITPCVFLPEEYVGNFSGKIHKILTTASYRHFVNGMSLHPVCSKCIW